MYKRRKLIIGIIAAVLALLLIVPTLVSILSISAGAVKASDYDDDIAELKRQIREMQSTIDGLDAEAQQLEEDKKALRQQMDDNTDQVKTISGQKIELDQNVELVRLDMELLQKQVREYNKLIALKQQELDAAIAKEEQQVEVFKDRIRAMEENGEISYLLILFKARSLSDLLDRLDLIEEVAENDRVMINELVAAREAVAEAQQEIEAEKDRLDEKKIELEETQKRYNLQREEADGFLQGLGLELEALDDKYSDVKAEEDRLGEDILKFANERDDIGSDLKDVQKEQARLQAIEDAEAERVRQAALAAAAASKITSSSSDAKTYSSFSTSEPSEDGFIFPLPSGIAKVTSAFGYRIHPITGAYSLHRGVDLSAPGGTNIYAAKSGDVIVSTYSAAYGNYVVVSHGGGQATLYAHMTSRAVSEGDYVVQGSTIGYVGTTGWSTGNHLHFEVILDGEYYNPMAYITLR